MSDPRWIVRALALASIALLTSACDERSRELPTAPAEAPAPDSAAASIAWLAISDSAPKAGATIVVTAFATGREMLVGSYAARLTFAPAGLTYVGEAEDAPGMQAINAKAGDVAIAGVNLEGYKGGELFSVTLRVENPSALNTLALSMSELTGVNYRDERATLSVQKALRVARAR